MKTKLTITLISCLMLIACNNAQGPKVKHELPEPESAGAKVFDSFCSNCHAPPRIKSHKADEWRNIVERMQNHRLKKAYHLLTDSEKETLLTYLEKHSI
ncbi:MAG: hypothetical protein OEM38_00705 [Gammaproteobacteria bacterium]|nr:hypothetical protein [Gammaproteobacteria bacterium]